MSSIALSVLSTLTINKSILQEKLSRALNKLERETNEFILLCFITKIDARLTSLPGSHVYNNNNNNNNNSNN